MSSWPESQRRIVPSAWAAWMMVLSSKRFRGRAPSAPPLSSGSHGDELPGRQEANDGNGILRTGEVRRGPRDREEVDHVGALGEREAELSFAAKVVGQRLPRRGGVHGREPEVDKGHACGARVGALTARDQQARVVAVLAAPGDLGEGLGRDGAGRVGRRGLVDGGGGECPRRYDLSLPGVPQDQAPVLVRGDEEGARGLPDGVRQPRPARGVDGRGAAAAAGGAGGQCVLEEVDGAVLLEGVDDGAVRVADEHPAGVARVHQQAHEAGGRGAGVPLPPEVGQAEVAREAAPVEVVGQDVAGHDLRRDARPRVRVPHAQLVAGVEADDAARAQAQRPEGRRPRRLQHLVHAPLPEDVDAPGAGAALARAHGEQRLHHVVAEAAARHAPRRAAPRSVSTGPLGRATPSPASSAEGEGGRKRGDAPDLRADAVAGLLVGGQELGPDARRQVPLDPRLLAAQ